MYAVVPLNHIPKRAFSSISVRILLRTIHLITQGIVLTTGDPGDGVLENMNFCILLRLSWIEIYGLNNQEHHLLNV